MTELDLNNKFFTASKNSENGEVSDGTVFHYFQSNNIISAEYFGGAVEKGHLLGHADGQALIFSYHHINRDGVLRTGKCETAVSVNSSGKIILDEKWQWTNGDMGESTLIETDPSDFNEVFYDVSAPAYDDQFSVYEPYRRQILNFIQYLPAKGSVLDLGCGSGINAGLFSEASQYVTGVDISEKMIELAQSQCPGGEFIKGDIRNYSAGRRYDSLVLSFSIVHLIREEGLALLGRLGEFLKPGGYLYLSFMEGKGQRMEKTGFSTEPAFFSYYSVEEVCDKLVSAGFRVVEQNVEDYVEKDGSVTKDIFLIFNKE